MKDEEAFAEWVSHLGLTHWTTKGDQYPLNLKQLADDTFHAISADDGWSTQVLDDAQDNYIDVDIADEILQFVDPRDVVILMEVGNEKLRYLTGYATAIAVGRPPISININTLTDQVAKAYPDLVVTEPQY